MMSIQLMVITVFLLVTGCTTMHDSTIAETPNIACNLGTGVLFDNQPSYLSKGEKDARVSELFGGFSKDIYKVELIKSSNLLTAKFYDQDNQIIQTKVELVRKYEVSGKRIVINKWHSCKPGEAGAGCTWGRIELSCTQNQDLMVKRVTGGAGLLVLIVPIAGGDEYISVYKRSQ